MKQLTQQLKSGKMEILDVPFPTINKNQVLVQNHYSVISSGTEGKNVSDARKGYLAKARSRKKEVKMVIDMIRSEGLRNTYGLVMNKLEAPSPLGYSCSGEVIAVGSSINDLKIGDKVACGGEGAYHADIVSIYRNLCVKIPDQIDLRQAAFCTIASIAIQGIRQADLRFGENCTVIGLGLLGLITIQVLKAAGIKAIGVDINPAQLERAKESGADLALLRGQDGIESIISDFTYGHGTDAVIITAATSSNDPVEFAGEISRKKGRIIIVGAVPTGFSRTNYFRKELDLRMSSSYGPGRYDVNYEEKGIDYPIGYVRFTENRNMQSFIDLLAEKKLNIDSLITHVFDLQNANQAYNLILSKQEPFVGVLIKYNENPPTKRNIIINNTISDYNTSNVGFIGAGNFAQNVVLPSLKRKCNFISIASAEGNMSRYVAEKYGFQYCAETPEKLLEDNNISTVFILTRHNLHAEYIIKALSAGKNVIVEKPLAMNYNELEAIRTEYEKAGKGLMLGFNRRFSTLTLKMIQLITREQKKSINIRINAGAVPPDHWVHDPEIGGGRIIGEVCHFIDLAGFIAGSRAKNIHAFALSTNSAKNDTVTINIEYQNGSIASICYFSNGNSNIPKERVEVFSNSTVILINDFRSMNIYTQMGCKKIKLRTQDKGHSRQFSLICDTLSKGGTFPIPFNEIYHSSLVTLETLRSINEKRSISISE